MTRRNFLLKGASVALPFAVVLNVSCSKKDKKGTRSSQSSRDVEFELMEITIDDLQQKMAQGLYTAEELVNLYLNRIKEIDQAGPAINSVIEVNPDAVEIAKSLDSERKAGKVRGPLHGIPVLIKDNIDTADKMLTTAGSIAMEGNRAEKDAHIVSKLRQAGAVILGKTNLSEWANFRSTRSSSGWSSRGGQTKNPYILSRNPCGSSSGSGAAVAANLCVVAIGTETNGSIACPSSINGIVGVKPTVGLVSRSGIIPISETQDTAGPMTRTVRDAAIVLTAIAGEDKVDAATSRLSGLGMLDYSSFLNADGLAGKRIGLERSYLKVHEGVDALLQNAIELMKSKGAEIVEVDLLKRLNVDQEEFELLQYEFKDGLNKYLANSQGKVKSLAELISFNKENEEQVMPFFKQEILEQSQAKEGLEREGYKKVLAKVKETAQIIDDVLKENNLQVICGPTNGPAWCTDLVNGDHFLGYGMYSPAAMAGYPSITVPMGQLEKLPVGITFFASAFQESMLFEIGYAFEQASLLRRPPEFLSTLDYDLSKEDQK